MIRLSGILIFLLGSFPAGGNPGTTAVRAKVLRPISVSDMIEMVRPVSAKGHDEKISYFSPDGRHFLVLLRRGAVSDSTNDFELALFETASAFHSPKPDVLLSLRTSSNQDAVADIRWLSNDTIAFLGQIGTDLSQVYTLNIASRKLKQITHCPQTIRAFDITPDQKTLVYHADRPEEAKGLTERIRQQGIVIEGQPLVELITGTNTAWQAQEAYLESEDHQGAISIDIPAPYVVSIWSSLSISPDGKYVVIGSMLSEVPKSWADYQNEIIQQAASSTGKQTAPYPVCKLLVYDRDKKSIAALLDAPVGLGIGIIETHWLRPDDRILLRSYLPLNIDDAVEREYRKKSPYPITVQIESRTVEKATSEEWRSALADKSPLKIRVEEELNAPPKLVAEDPTSGKQAVLLDLNPQFKELEFGKVEIVSWEVGHGIVAEGGLYLPPDFVSGKRYPLVIQTHGFDRARFSMDGRSEWSSGYAARPLAATGIIVLQAFKLRDRAERDPSISDPRFGVTPEQADRNFEVTAYEKAVDYLNGRGLIDPDRVGIIGFSRTVCFVGYLLTHSKHHFAAASLIDGIDCGYFSTVAFREAAWDVNQINGGVAPFGDGLNVWLKESPGFLLAKVDTPIQLVALRRFSVLQQWEWYVALSEQRKPVDFVLIPDEDGNNHLLFKPWERLIVQQGLVDWFCFWLKNEPSPDPLKSGQYSRWEALRQSARGTEHSPVPPR